MKINFKVRFKNPVFVAQMVMAVLLPIMAYAGLTLQDMTSWSTVGKTLLTALSNPYVLGLVIVNFWQSVNDPTTAGLTDSKRAMEYTEPKRD